MPAFIDDAPGGYVASPPFQHDGAVLNSVFIRGDQTRLQTLVDSTLNRVAADVHFEVVTSLILVAALYVDRATSIDARWAKGLSTESDVGFWVLVRGGRGGDTSYRWWPVFLFVDQVAALVAGREIYGFPKYPADIKAADASHRNDFSANINATYFETDTPTGRPVRKDLVRLKHDRGSFWNILLPQGAGVTQVAPGALKATIGLAFAEVGSAPPDGISFPYLAMPMLFLKQFRDVARPREACYQALASLDITGTPTSIRVIPGSVVVSLLPSKSLDITGTLGLAAENKSLGALTCVEMSFQAGYGAEL